MRRKPLNVVFDEGVVNHANKIVDQISNSKPLLNDCTINRSEVLRCAMELGLLALQDKIDSQLEKGLSPKGLIKVSNLKAMLRK